MSGIDESRKCYIWSFEHRGWWKPGRMGYTDDLSKAGKYHVFEAEDICAKANINYDGTGQPEEVMVPCDRFKVREKKAWEKT